MAAPEVHHLFHNPIADHSFSADRSVLVQKFQLSLLLLISIAFCGVIAEFCHTAECRSERQHLWDVTNYKEEAQKYKELLANSSCSVCNIVSTPCYNGGTCVPFGLYDYNCTCPGNTTGKHCDTILTCDDPTPFCGVNALCAVNNHKKSCYCPPGYTGDPKVNCNLEVKTACLSGDPHFVTFDQAKYDYMGTCPYYVMKACDESVDFSIEAVNFVSTCSPDPNHKTCLKEFTLKTLGHRFKVDENLNYWIDDYPLTLPYAWPNNKQPDTAQIYADESSDNKITITDTVHNMTITLQNFALCVTVPLTPFFYGNDTMCGLFGNIDDNCKNDIRARNNSLIVFPTCQIDTNPQAIEFMDTWVSDSSVNNCLEGAMIMNLTTTNYNCNYPDAQSKCGLIDQAFNGNGPFGACSAMGHDLIDKYYHDCTYSVCEANCDPADTACNTKVQCNVLDTFAQLCMARLPNVNIDSWRTDNFCPFKCPPFSTYSLKTPACQDSCPDNNYSNSSICHDHIVEGCTCNQNYYFDANSDLEGYNYVCRPLDKCGCKDNNGTYFAPGSVTIDSTCSTRTSCSDGLLFVENISCSVSGQCNNVDGYPTCQCLAGYRGDGFNCTDINECTEDPTKCNANINQGTCNNLPGTYSCSCYAPYEGAECTDYKPRRHCADLKMFHGISQDGTYNVSIGAGFSTPLYNDQLNWTTVYCDMTSNGGGWTLMGHGNNTGGVPYARYVDGFGDPATQNTWLGLENIHLMTTEIPTSLKVVIEKCPVDSEPNQNCIYDYFNIKDASTQYSIFLNGSCQDGSQEGWITWDVNSVGPAFTTFDVPDSYNCSGQFNSVGWWYKSSRTCGKANLNGLRFICGDKASNSDKDSYIEWYGNPIKDAYMYLRPLYFPLYDSHIPHPTISPPPPTQAPTETATSA